MPGTLFCVPLAAGVVSGSGLASDLNLPIILVSLAGRIEPLFANPNGGRKGLLSVGCDALFWVILSLEAAAAVACGPAGSFG